MYRAANVGRKGVRLEGVNQRPALTYKFYKAAVLSHTLCISGEIDQAMKSCFDYAFVLY